VARQLYENGMNFFAPPPPRQALINGRHEVSLLTRTTDNDGIVVEIVGNSCYQMSRSYFESNNRSIVRFSEYDDLADLTGEIARKIENIRRDINVTKVTATNDLEQNTYIVDEKIFYKFNDELRCEISPIIDDSFTRLLEQILEDLSPILNEEFQIHVLK
jgi:hypothetical protein